MEQRADGRDDEEAEVLGVDVCLRYPQPHFEGPNCIVPEVPSHGIKDPGGRSKIGLAFVMEMAHESEDPEAIEEDLMTCSNYEAEN